MSPAPNIAPASRRDRFSRFMQAFNPTPAFDESWDNTWVIRDLHGSAYRKLAARADLARGSQQLLVGGIGSGKTTELRLTEEELTGRSDLVAVRVDVSRSTDLSRLESGALLAALGDKLVPRIRTPDSAQSEAMGQLVREIRELGHGKLEFVAYDGEPDAEQDEPDGYWTQRPGVLQPAEPEVQSRFVALARNMTKVAATLPGAPGLVAIFDGLDRLGTPDRFWQVAFQDLKALRAAKISCVLAAPLSVLYDDGKAVTDHFDRVEHIPTVDPKGPGKQKLHELLKARDRDGLVPDDLVEMVCDFSGGLIRDLLTLLRDAAEQAYLDGRDGLDAGTVTEAAFQLGNSYVRGLNPNARSRLLAFAAKGNVVFEPKEQMSLLATRRLLEYSATDIRIHPALKFALEHLGME